MVPLVTQAEIDNDGRSIALTLNSARILQSIGVWPALENSVTPINTVHVSARGHFGVTRIQASEEKVPALGYVVPAMLLATALNKLLKANQSIDLFNPNKVTSLIKNAQGWQVTLENQGVVQTIQTRLIIAADGTQSTIRKLQKIATTEKNYQQSAISTRITINSDHKNIAYERFMTDGALALLPLAANNCGLIWTASDNKIQELMALPDQEFLKYTQNVFGYRLGRWLTVNKRFVYPLKMLFATEQVQAGLVLIGNAAHTIHPLAAQGFNLGLSDVAVLAQTLVDALKNKTDFASLAVLKKYEETQINTQQQIIGFTDRLTRIFAHDILPFNLLRNCGLLTLDICAPLKHRLANTLMGTAGHLTDLQLGIPYEQ